MTKEALQRELSIILMEDNAMFLKHQKNHNLVEVLNLEDLWNPFMTNLLGRYHAGEEMQDPETFEKIDLCFPSDENLPSCWIDPHYHDRDLMIGTRVTAKSQ